MKCVTCSSTDSSLLKLQTYVDNNTLKEISLVLPDFEIPETQGPVYVCVTCQEQVTTFHRIKRASLQNLWHLNLYGDILKTTSNVKFNDLKIIIDNNKLQATSEQDITFKLNPNCINLSDDENQLIEKDSNLSNGEKLKQSSSKQRRFKCRDCDKTFTWRHHLKTHRRVHTGERPHKCSTCQKTFTFSSNLNAHTIIHTGEKPHECDVCHKTFTHKRDLTQHKRCHSGERPYECAVCTKAFTQSSSLSRHMRTHSGEKPHQCQVCQYKFTQADHLKRHMRIHTGDKPYICNLCNKSFTQSNNLNDHKRRIHNSKNLD